MFDKPTSNQWPELEALDKKYTTLETRLGFPPKRRYHCMLGGHNTNTLIIEREWESMSTMEEVYNKAFDDSEYQALGEEGSLIVESTQIELYRPQP